MKGASSSIDSPAGAGVSIDPAAHRIANCRERERAARAMAEGWRRVRSRALWFSVGCYLIFLGFTFSSAPARYAPFLAAGLLGGTVGLIAVLHTIPLRQARMLAVAERCDAIAARLEDLPGDGDPAEESGAGHRFAQDLDLMPGGALFRRLNQCRTTAGAAQLEDWLHNPTAEAAGIRERQQAVGEMAGRLELCEAWLFSAGGKPIDSASLGDLVRHRAGSPGWVTVLGIIAVPSAAAIAVFSAPLPAALGIAGIGLVGLEWLFRHRSESWLDRCRAVGPHARRLAALAATLEGAALEQPRAAALAERILGSARCVRTVALPLGWLATSLEPGWDVLVVPLMVRPILALATARLLRRGSQRLLDLVEATAEMDALISMGAYAFAEPRGIFPLIRESGAGYRAEGLAHPLLPSATAVPNDVDLSDAVPVSVITGSNMSGKSTWLRALGVNHALALAGAPVQAQSMTVAPHRLYASIAAADSLADGCSRFQREAERIAMAMEAARRGEQVLLIVDELFSGTNSYDRQSCADILIAEAHRLGMLLVLSTHDLAIAESSSGRATLWHFEDTLDESRRALHYRLIPGICAAGNGLEVARRAGIVA